jgi:hypothetical protein
MEQRADEVKERLSSRVSETAEAARHRAQEFASATATQARDMTSRLGHRVREFAGKVRDKSPHERLRTTTNQVADRLDSAGTYLEEKSFEGMIDDVAAVIRKYPMQSLLIGIGIGFLLSRRRSGRRAVDDSYYES